MWWWCTVDPPMYLHAPSCVVEKKSSPLTLYWNLDFRTGRKQVGDDWIFDCQTATTRPKQDVVRTCDIEVACNELKSCLENECDGLRLTLLG